MKHWAIFSTTLKLVIIDMALRYFTVSEKLINEAMKCPFIASKSAGVKFCLTDRHVFYCAGRGVAVRKFLCPYLHLPHLLLMQDIIMNTN